MSHRAFRASLAVFLGLCASGAEALNLPLAVPDLVERSEVVATGTVQSMHGLRMGPDGQVYTIVQLRAEQVLKGPAAGLYEILVPGGVLPEEDLAVRVSHHPVFRRGERALVALEPSAYEEGLYRVTGLEDGKVELPLGLRPGTSESAVSFFERASGRRHALAAHRGAQASAGAIGYDFLSVAVHEQGHFIGLGDLYNNQGEGGSVYRECMGTGNQAKTMYGLIGQGDISPRDLHPADILGIRALYGNVRLPAPAGRNNEELFSYFCAERSNDELTCSPAGECGRPVRWISQVTYHIREADFHPQHVQLLQQGMGVWGAVPGISFSSRYGGNTNVDTASTNDNVNLFRVSKRGNRDDDQLVGGSTLAVTQFAWFISNGHLAGSDIVFNHRITWDPALPAAATPTPPRGNAGDGGGCGPVHPLSGGGPPEHLGRVLLLGAVALILAATRRRSAAHRPLAGIR
jgi:hypothetical protein